VTNRSNDDDGGDDDERADVDNGDEEMKSE
jgi:hypothetical protein